MRRLKITVILITVLSLAIVIVVPPYLVTAITSEVGNGGIPASIQEFSNVPQDIAEEADRVATELFGEYQEGHDEFVRQLLVTYSEAQDKDFIIFFNSGGAGWNLLETTEGWYSIFNGITQELGESGYTLLSLNYLRTVRSWEGLLDEAMNMISLYPSKTRELTSRVEFLTEYIPEVRVILIGESNGTVICDRVMNTLKDNPRVYSIQTGTPFWYKDTTMERKLVLKSGGIIPDSFSGGDIFRMIGATLEGVLGFSRQQSDAGTILNSIAAPGHDYWWEYPAVSTEITRFLYENFGVK